MPALIAEEFSYEASAKVLRLADVAVTEKLATCEKLLSLSEALAPQPFALVLNHTLFVLQPKPPSNAFIPHLPAYWTLLLHTLKAAKTDIHRLQERPNNLVKAAIAHIASSDPTVVQPVADALLHLTSSTTGRPFSQDITLHAALLAAVVKQLPKHPGLHPLAVWLLHAHARLQSRSRDPRRVLSVAVENLLHPLLVAPPRLRAVAEPLLADAIFTVPTLSRLPLLQFLKKSENPFLPEAVEFLFRACVRVARSAPAAHAPHERSTIGWKRNASSREALTSDVSRVLQFLDELIVTLRDSMRDAKRENQKTDDLALSLKISAIASLFEVANEVDAYRPSYDTEVQEGLSKKVRVDGKSERGARPKSDTAEHTQKGVFIGSRVQELFIELTVLLRELYCDNSSSQELVKAVSKALQALLSFSLDVVEESVPDLLVAIVSRHGEKDGIYRHVSSRQNLFCSLVRTHRETRSLPLFFHRLTGSSLGFSLLQHLCQLLDSDNMQKTLAEAIETLPRGQSEQCIRSLMGASTGLVAADVPCICFLVALLLEATNTAEFKSTWSAVRDIVLPCITGMNHSVQSRCGLLFLLSSILFGLTRAGLSSSSPELIAALSQSGILTASGMSEEIQKDSALGVEQKLFQSFSTKEKGNDVTELLCVIRTLAMSSHSLLGRKPDEKDEGLVKSLIYLIFDLFDQLVNETEEHTYWPGATLFHKSSPREAAVSIVRSLIPLLDLFASEDKVPSGLAGFLGYASERFDYIDQSWEDLLESSMVHRALGNSLKLRLSSATGQNHRCAADSGTALCSMSKVFRLLRSLPATYLSTSEERAVAKTISRAYQSLCCKRSKDEAAQAILQLPGASFSSLSRVVPMAVNEFEYDQVLKVFVDKVANGALTYDEGTELLDSVLGAWGDGKTLRVAPCLLRNCTEVLRHFNIASPIDVTVLKRISKHVLSIQEQCVAAFANGGNNRDMADNLAVMGSMLDFRGSLENCTSPTREKAGDVVRLGQRTDEFLNSVFESAVAQAVRLIMAGYTGDSGEDNAAAAGRSFLVAVCEGRPIAYQVFQPGKQSSFTMGRLSALSLHFLKSQVTEIRSVGVDVLCAIGSNENDRAVRLLGETVYRELQTWCDLPQHNTGDSLNMESANKLLRRFRLIGGKVLAGACALCGFESGSDGSMIEWSGSNEFLRFKAARKRRDLSNLRTNRETTGLILCEMLEYAGLLVGELDKLQSVKSRDRSVNADELDEMKRITRECISFGLDAAEISASRKPPCRLDAAHAQATLVLLCPLVQTVASEDDAKADSFEDCIRGQVARICKVVLHQHSGVRWAVTRLLRSVLHGKLISASTARAVGAAYGEVAGCGRREVVRAALADVCTMLASAGTGAVRREVMPGVAKLFSKAGEDGVQEVMVALGSEGKEVLRGVREMYAGDFQYRGK